MSKPRALKFISKEDFDCEKIPPNVDMDKLAICTVHDHKKETLAIKSIDIDRIIVFCRNSISGNPDNPCLGCPNEAEAADAKIAEFIELLDNDPEFIKAKEQ